MNYVVDLHTHTYASGHAYSTIMENITWASENGIEVLATTDHGPTMPGGPKDFYFGNFKAIPRVLKGVLHLKGCEANIIDINGTLDIPPRFIGRMDIIIASLHDVCIDIRKKEDNTKALLNAMDNEAVDILGHLGNPTFPIFEEQVVKKAKDKNKIIEINNGSFKSRPGCEGNCIRIASLCKEYKVPVVLDTDAHFLTQIGDFTLAEKILKAVNMPEELIINTNKHKILNYLKSKERLKDI